MSRTVRRGAKLSYVYFDWQHWAVIAGAVLLGVWGLTTGVRPVISGYDAARDVVAKTREYRGLVAENRRMEEELEFLVTDEGREHAARVELGYVDPDEQVLAIEIEEETAAKPSLGETSRAWLENALDRTIAWGSDTGELLSCLFGSWDAVMPAEPAPGSAALDG